MNITLLGARMRLLSLGLGLALALVAGVFAFGVPSSHAQNGDFDADGYADEIEEELGSNQNDPDSTPEHFALLWSCTDGNDNDGDGGRDFRDDGCKNAVPAAPAPSGGGFSSPGEASSPGGEASSRGGESDGGDSGGSTPGSGSSGSGNGSSGSGDGSSGSGDGNAVFGGANAPAGGGSDSGDASDTGAGDGSGDGTTTDATSTDAGGDAGAGDENAASDDSGGGDGNGFPWGISLVILAVGLVLAALIYALASAARSRRVSAR